MKTFSVEFKCPYCCLLNKIRIELGSVDPRFIICDNDNAGCGRYLVFRPVWDISASALVGPVPWESIDAETEEDVFYCPTCGKNPTKYGETCVDCLKKIG